MDTSNILRALLGAKSILNDSFTTEASTSQRNATQHVEGTDLSPDTIQDHTTIKNYHEIFPEFPPSDEVLILKSEIDVGDYEVTETELQEDQTLRSDTITTFDPQSAVPDSSFLVKDEHNLLVTVKEIQDEASTSGFTTVFLPSSAIHEQSQSFYSVQEHCKALTDSSMSNDSISPHELSRRDASISSQVSNKTCKPCDKTFVKVSGLRKHWKFYCPHQKRLYRLLCKVCGNLSSKSYSWRCHIIKKHGNDMWDKLKNHVEYVTVTPTKVKEKVKNVSAEEDPLSELNLRKICKFCKKSFKRLHGLQSHSNFFCPFQTKFKFLCKVCGIIVSSRDILGSHVKRMHGNDVWEKLKHEIHQVTFKTSKAEKSENAYQAVDPPSMIPNVRLNCLSKQPSLSNSVNMVNSSYICKFCNKTFSNLFSLKRHSKCPCPFQKKDNMKMIKSRYNTNNCKFCKRGFYNQINLKRHIEFNCPFQKKYEMMCTLCSLKFSSKQNVRKHLFLVHEIRDSNRFFSKLRRVVNVVTNYNINVNIDSDFNHCQPLPESDKSHVGVTHCTESQLENNHNNYYTKNDIHYSSTDESEKSHNSSTVKENGSHVTNYQSDTSSITLKSGRKLCEIKFIGICGVCKLDFPYLSNLEYHYLQKSHEKPNILCVKCKQTFDSLQKFKCHLGKIKSKYVCRAVMNNFSSKYLMRQLETDPKSNSFNDLSITTTHTAENSDLIFNSAINSDPPNTNSKLEISPSTSKSVRKMGDNKFIGVCRACRLEFRYLCDLEAHYVKTAHEKLSVNCVKCEQMFNSVTEFKNHLVNNGTRYLCGTAASSNFADFVKSLLESNSNYANTSNFSDIELH